MTNQDIEAARTYHNATKHSYASVRHNPHFLDWANQPLLFKLYPTPEPVALPNPRPPSGVPTLAALASPGVSPAGDVIPDRSALAKLLYFSAGITRHKTYPGGEIHFRAAACTGALYETELYLVCGDLPDLAAGVYHFSVHDFALRRLRPGDYRGVLLEAGGGDPAIAVAPAVVVTTGTYWRNAWKYQARTYRHFFWDSGTILANLLAMAAAQGLPARIVLGFVDDTVNQLLGLDTDREVTLELIPLGHGAGPPPAVPGELAPSNWETIPRGQREVDYPIMRQMHAASSLMSGEEVRAWRAGAPRAPAPAPVGPLFPLQPIPDADLPDEPIESVILRRGSSRRFVHKPITFAQLSTMLDRATRGVPADFLESTGSSLNDLYLIVHAVEGLPPGAYFFQRDRRALERLKEGDFRRTAGYLGLEQDLPADASVDIFFMTDLEPVLARFGNRGYRAAQLEAGIMGGKLYLAAYAHRLGATGLTFYDDEVTEFFSPHAAGQSTIFLVALGVAAKRPLL